jgi:transcriptional regulator with XRE-family HTH domain
MPNPIRFYRERAGLSQQKLADESGLTLEYLRALEGGTKRRLTMRLAPIAVVLNVPVATLMV